MLAKFAPAPGPSSASQGQELLVASPSLTPVFQLLKEHYSGLVIGYSIEGGLQEWITVSRHVTSVLMNVD